MQSHGIDCRAISFSRRNTENNSILVLFWNSRKLGVSRWANRSGLSVWISHVLVTEISSLRYPVTRFESQNNASPLISKQKIKKSLSDKKAGQVSVRLIQTIWLDYFNQMESPSLNAVQMTSDWLNNLEISICWTALLKLDLTRQINLQSLKLWERHRYSSDWPMLYPTHPSCLSTPSDVLTDWY